MKKSYHVVAVLLVCTAFLCLGADGKALATVDVLKPPVFNKVSGNLLFVRDHVDRKAVAHIQRAEGRLNYYSTGSIIITHRDPDNPPDEYGCHYDDRGVWHCH